MFFGRLRHMALTLPAPCPIAVVVPGPILARALGTPAGPSLPTFEKG